MSLFVDRLLLQLSDPAQLRQLLAPADDTGHTRLLALLNTMYRLDFATIHDVQDVTVQQIESQRLFLTTHQTRGVWRQTTPSNQYTDVAYEGASQLEPIWLDIAAQVQVKLLIEVDSGAVESIDTHQLDHITIQLKQAAPFDPQDPANVQSYPLRVALFIRETLDVAAALHDVKLARTVIEQASVYQKELESGERVSLYAPIVIFPPDALQGLPFNADALRAFFARENVLVVFMTPA